MKWQYMKISLGHQTSGESISTLNNYGKDGWEAFAVESPPSGQLGPRLFWLKRPYESKPLKVEEVPCGEVELVRVTA